MKTREQMIDEAVKYTYAYQIGDLPGVLLDIGEFGLFECERDIRPAFVSNVRKTFIEIVSKSSDQSATSANSEIS